MVMALFASAMKPANAAEQLSLTLSTDKQSYEAGQLITITGKVLDASQQGIALATVSIQVNDPDGKAIHITSVISSMDGSFTDQFTIPAGYSNGSYTVFAIASKAGYSDASNQVVYVVVPEFLSTNMIWLALISILLVVLITRRHKITV